MDTPKKRVFTLSASSLQNIQACETLYNYSNVQRLVPTRTEKPLDFGGLVHYMLRPYYFSKILPEHRKDYHLSNVLAPIFNLPRHEVVNACEEIGRLKALSTDLSADDRLAAIAAFRDYVAHYGNEDWTTLEVEQPFSKILYEDEQLVILYEGIVDLIVIEGGTKPINVDHKTGGRDRHIPETNNQIIGTCWAFGVNNFTINKILQVKDTPFRREKYYAIEEMTNEWQRDTIHYAMRMIHYIDSNYFPMNRNSCGAFGSCRFLKVCKSPVSARPTMLEGLFKKSSYKGIYNRDELFDTIVPKVLGKYEANAHAQVLSSIT